MVGAACQKRDKIHRKTLYSYLELAKFYIEIVCKPVDWFKYSYNSFYYKKRGHVHKFESHAIQSFT